MSDRLAMARPGTQYSSPLISISWPKRRDGTPGPREVQELPPGKRDRAIRRAITEGAIVETDLPVARHGSRDLVARPALRGRVFRGGTRQALEVMKIPAGPVIRRVFVPAGELEDRDFGATPERQEWPKTREPEEGTEVVEELNQQAPTPEERIAALVADHTQAQLLDMARELELDGVKVTMTKTEIATLIVEAAPPDPADVDEPDPT